MSRTCIIRPEYRKNKNIHKTRHAIPPHPLKGLGPRRGGTMEVKEYEDVFSIDLNGDLTEITAVDTAGGLTIEYGKKRGTNQPELNAILFDKRKWKPADIQNWWADNELHFVLKTHQNTKLPLVNFLIDDDDVYIVGCIRNSELETTLSDLLASDGEFEQMGRPGADIDGVVGRTYLIQQSRIISFGPAISFNRENRKVLLGEGADLLELDFDVSQDVPTTAKNRNACVVSDLDGSLQLLFACGNTPEEAEAHLDDSVAQYVKAEVGEVGFSQMVLEYEKRGPEAKLRPGPSGRGKRPKKKKRKNRR